MLWKAGKENGLLGKGILVMRKLIGKIILVICSIVFLIILWRLIETAYFWGIQTAYIRLYFFFVKEAGIWALTAFMILTGIGIFLSKYDKQKLERLREKQAEKRRQKEEQRYQKSLAKQESRLLKLQNTHINRTTETDKKPIRSEKDVFKQVEYVFTSVDKDSFSYRICCGGFAAVVISLVVMLLMLIPMYSEWLAFLGIGIFFFGSIVGWSLFLQADKIHKGSRLYGIVLVDIWQKQIMELEGKELYLIESIKELEDRIPKTKFHLARYGRMKALGERETAIEKEIKEIADMMRTLDFREKVLHAIERNVDVMDNEWYITPLKDVKMKRSRIFGCDIEYRDKRGVQRTMFLSKDIEEYQQMKKWLLRLNKEESAVLRF